jgi:hypothetical protein
MTLAGNRWLYLFVFAPCALAGALLLSLGRTTIDNLDCKSSKYREGNFLAYCQSKQYGNYEHGALYYGLEPGIRDSIRNAKVMFLGTSTTQAAFSTQAVRAYFNKIGLPFFVMGFSYGEVSPFALAVLKRWKAAPQVLVISADPFFFDGPVSEPALETLAGKPDFVWRLTMKMMFQRVHRFLCAIAPFICAESEPSIFRSARNGQWNWIGPYVAERTIPIDYAAARTVTPEILEPWRQSGERFLDEVGLNRRCVVLTGIPSPISNSIGIAKALAAALKTSSIFPPVDGLATVDGGHLNLASAERWSDQFLDALTPILERCVAPRTSARHPRD